LHIIYGHFENAAINFDQYYHKIKFVTSLLYKCLRNYGCVLYIGSGIMTEFSDSKSRFEHETCRSVFRANTYL